MRSCLQDHESRDGRARLLPSREQNGRRGEWHCRVAAKAPDVVPSVDLNQNILWLQRLMTVPFGAGA